ncbi:MAG: hypothetical protein H7145_07945 [Akkermansiaceae bacterium]|nr:hypothetical protein [Armatimonadota bacterium]
MEIASSHTPKRGVVRRRVNARRSASTLSHQQEEQLGVLAYALRDASETVSSIITTMDRIQHHLENSVRNMESANRILRDSETSAGGTI